MLKTSNILYLLSNLFEFIGIPSFLTTSIISGFIEVTNGVSFISNLTSCTIRFQLTLCSFTLGFGGFSVLLQVLSITSKAQISIKPYFYGKLLQACFAAMYTYIIL